MIFRVTEQFGDMAIECVKQHVRRGGIGLEPDTELVSEVIRDYVDRLRSLMSQNYEIELGRCLQTALRVSSSYTPEIITKYLARLNAAMEAWK